MSDEAFQNIDPETYITECRQLCSEKKDECLSMSAELTPRPETVENAVQQSFREYNHVEILQELMSGFENDPNFEPDTVCLMASSPPKESSSAAKKKSTTPRRRSSSAEKSSSSHQQPDERETRSKSKSSKSVAKTSLKHWLSTKFDKFFKKGSHSASAASADADALLHQEMDRIMVNLSLLERAIDDYQEFVTRPGSSTEIEARKRVVRALRDRIVQDCEAVAAKFLEYKSNKEKELKKRRPGGKTATERPEDTVQSPAKKIKGAATQTLAPPAPPALEGAALQNPGPSTARDGPSSTVIDPKSVHVYLFGCTSDTSKASSKDTLSTRVTDSVEDLNISETEDSKDNMDEN